MARLRRVAKKDPDGKLVKLPAYDDLLERVNRPTVEGCCCDSAFFWARV